MHCGSAPLVLCYKVFVLKVFISSTAKVFSGPCIMPYLINLHENQRLHLGLTYAEMLPCFLCQIQQMHYLCPCSYAGTKTGRKTHNQSFCCSIHAMWGAVSLISSQNINTATPRASLYPKTGALQIPLCFLSGLCLIFQTLTAGRCSWCFTCYWWTKIY